MTSGWRILMWSVVLLIATPFVAVLGAYLFHGISRSATLPDKLDDALDFEDALGTESRLAYTSEARWWRLEETGRLRPGATVVVSARRPDDGTNLGCAPWGVLFCSEPVDAPVMPGE